MPTSPMKNLLYRAALPVLAPSPKGQLHHMQSGHPVQSLADYEHLLCRHHVLGSALLLRQGDRQARVDTSVDQPAHHAAADTIYRVASITKMATALVTLLLVQDGVFTLDTPVASLLPDAEHEPALQGVTVRMLLSHSAGFSDLPQADAILMRGGAFHEVLHLDGLRFAAPGAAFRYCNFGFGLMGCILEHQSGLSIEQLFRERLFAPLGMEATLDATTLDERRIMPISRVLRYHPGQDVTITALGRHSIAQPDPLRHFGHTAGSMYTNAASLSRLLQLIADGGVLDGRTILSANLIAEMTRRHATYGTISPGMSYGLGLVILEDPALSEQRILGHQGYAYGCADGAFFEEGTGSQLVFLNGGCSEARTGRLGLCNRDLLRWALRKELPQWM